jgi:hypothetical protein
VLPLISRLPLLPPPRPARRRLRDGAVVDDIDLSVGYPAEEVIRRVGQLG